MVLTAKRLRELGKDKLVSELIKVYDTELDETKKAYEKAAKLHTENIISLKENVLVALEYYEVCSEAYHFLND